MKIFVDLDSTLNRLQDAWLAAIKRELGETIRLQDITHWDRLKDAKYQDLFRAPGFFRHLGVEVGAQQALQMAQAAGHEIYIATAAGPWNYADKDAWVREFFPFIPYSNVIMITCKGELAGPGKILIDDGPHNLEAWRAAGGIAVAYSQPWNTEWDGPRLRHWYELPAVLAKLKEDAA